MIAAPNAYVVTVYLQSDNDGWILESLILSALRDHGIEPTKVDVRNY